MQGTVAVAGLDQDGVKAADGDREAEDPSWLHCLAFGEPLQQSFQPRHAFSEICDVLAHLSHLGSDAS